MECPKCGGGAFLSEEELIKILENTKPLTIVIKAIYQCRACAEKFSRLMHDTLEGRKIKPGHTFYGGPPQTQIQPSASVEDPAEGLKFF